MSPLTSGRLSHSSGPLNGGSMTETDSSPVSPSEEFDDVVKVYFPFSTFLIIFIIIMDERRETASGQYLSNVFPYQSHQSTVHQ